MATKFSQGFVAEAGSYVFGRPSHKRSFFTKIAGTSALLLRRLVLLLMLSAPSVMLWADTDTASGTDFWGGLGKSVWGSTEGWAQDKLGEGRGTAHLAATAGELFSVNAEGSDWREELDGRLEDARLDLMRRGVRSSFDSVFGFVTDRLDEDRFRLKSDYRMGLAEGEHGWWHTDAMGLLSGLDGGAAGEGLYWQMGARNGGGYGTGEADDDDHRTVLNAGLGMRRLVWDGDWLLMGHMFYDRERSVGHSRAGLGVEAKGRHLDVYGNVYHALSDRVRVGNRWEQVRGGWEVALSGRLPRVDWLELSVSHSEWDEVLGVAGESETDYGVKMQVTPLVRFEGSYEDASDDDSSWSGELVFEYKFGEGISGQPSAGMLKLVSPEDRMWEFVRRDYGMKKGDVELKVVTPGDDGLRGQSSPAAASPTIRSKAFPVGVTYRDNTDFSSVVERSTLQIQTLVVHTDKFSGALSDPLTVMLDFDEAVPSGSSLSMMVRGDSDVGYRIVGASVFAGGTVPRVMIERKGELKHFSEDTFTFEEEIFWIKYFLASDGGVMRNVKTFDAHLMFLPSERTLKVKEDTDPPVAGKFRYRDNYRLINDNRPFESAEHFSLSGRDEGNVRLVDLEGNHIGVSLVHAPDRESPKDVDLNNVYTVHVSRLGTYPAGSQRLPVQTIFVAVEDAPSKFSRLPSKTFEVSENTDTVFVVGRPEGPGSYEYTLKADGEGIPSDNEYFELTTNTELGEARLKFKVAPDYERPRGIKLKNPTDESLAAANVYTVFVMGTAGSVESGMATVLVTVADVEEETPPLSARLRQRKYALLAGIENSPMVMEFRGGTPKREMTLTLEEGSGWSINNFRDRYSVRQISKHQYTYRNSGRKFSMEFMNSRPLPPGETFINVGYDDGDGNAGTLAIPVTAYAVPFGRADLTATENDLTVSDFPGVPDRASHGMFLDPSSPDSRRFEFKKGDGGVRHLVFRKGKRKRSGKWPDADEAVDADGDGVYTVAINYWPENPKSYQYSEYRRGDGEKGRFTYTAHVSVDPDPLESVKFLSTLEHWVEQGKLDTGYRLQASSGLDRPLSYQIESGGSGGDFELVGVGGDELRFRWDPVYDAETLSNNVLTLTVSASDDDPGAVKNVVTAALTVTVLPEAVEFITSSRELSARENVLEVGDVPVPANGAVTLSLGGADADLFELDGSRLSFKPGKGDALGKWPDADEHGDDDRDGVYELEVHQSLDLSRSAKYDLEVRVEEDAREDLGRRTHDLVRVEEGTTDTGVRLGKGREGLNRKLSYSVRELEVDGTLFEVRNGGELHFREAPTFKDEGNDFFANIYSALIDVEDDDPGEVRNRGVDEMRRVQVVPRFSAESLSGTAEENDLSVYVGGFSGLSPYVTVTVGGGADAGQFEWSGGALRFKAGTGDALGKWPDADDAWDDDGDGKYTVEMVQRTKYVWSKSTVTVGVSADAREELSFTSGTSVVTDSGVVDTGYRLQASSNLDRSVSYRIESGGSGGDFELVGVNGDELRFRWDPVYDAETLSNNVLTLTVSASDDDPGTVKNVVTAALTVTVLPEAVEFITSSRELSARENVLEVGDVPRPANGAVTLSLGGADASLFELDGSRLSFKPGKGDALGKWPDADEHGDVDGDGVYELEVHQSLGLNSAKYDLEVRVYEDAREDLDKKPLRDVEVEEGMTDTGFRLEERRGGLNREVSYSVRETALAGSAFFELRNGVELHFKEAARFKSEATGVFSNVYFVNVDIEDDDPGSVKNRVVDEFRVAVVPRFAAESLSGTAEENELSVDVGGFSGLSPHVTLSIVGGGDAGQFEWSGGALRFKAGTGDALGKWPDADEARDADGDGKYTVEVAQRTEYASTSTSTVTVGVFADAREGLSFSSGTSVVTDGGVDTGYRAAAVSELGDRKMFYEVISGGDGALFNVAGDELKFRAPQYWVPDGSNRYTVTLKAEDDDPGDVKNEAYVTVTISLLLALIEDTRELKAHENVLEVGDVPRPESDEVKLSLGGADASLFELDGSRLSFKPGKGDALGKWPDADDHGDADGDGVYELEVHQSLGLSRSAKYDLEVTVEEDAREDLVRMMPTGSVEEGMTDTGVRLKAVRGELKREVSYRPRVEGDGALFELRNGDELHFREAVSFKSEAGGIFSNLYFVNIDVEDDDPGSVKNRVVDLARVAVVPRFSSDRLSGTAKENELAVDVGGFSGLNPHVTVTLGGGADVGLFELSGGALRFKAGTDDALGKWPDADEAGDADGDGKYTVEVVQGTRFAPKTTSTVTVGVSADAREGLSFSSGASVVTEGGVVDTGYRAEAASELGDRKMFYEAISGGDGELFNVAVDELKFRAPQYWVPGASNRYTVTLKATDDDPGDVKNEAFVTVTVTVEPAPLVSGPVAGVAVENDLAVDVESFSGLDPDITLSLVGGEDSALFELSGGALRFKAGEGESLGKWPDADDAGDIDGDGKYTVEIEQADGVREAIATVVVSVKPDTREGLSFSSGTSVVTEGGVDTGYRAEAVSELGDRKMVYEVISGGDGELFNIAVDELKFRAPQYWVPDGSNRYTVTLKATDDDPGAVNNEAYVTVTVSLLLALIEDARELKAHENVLEVGDVPVPANGAVTLSLGGADADLFELDGSRLSFKPGKGDALGKWPDADEHGDDDRDGVYELEVHQSLGLNSAKYDLEVTVEEDAREDLGRKNHGEVRVEEGTTDTGVRLGKGRDGLNRTLSHSVRRLMLAGSLFEMRNGDELHFREAAEFEEENHRVSNIYFVQIDTEDDDPGSVKNRGYDEAAVVVVPRFAAASLSGTAEENDLSVDVGGFSGLNPYVTVTVGGGADAGQFEWSGGALRFKAGEGKALGKWPDADDAWDADGDGKYTVELVQGTRFLRSTSTVIVSVKPDAREGLSFSSGTSVVTEGGVDTGYRAEAASELGDRKMFYEVISGGDGELFNVAVDELKFRAPQYWVPDGSNRYTVTLKATDDDPGAVNNEAYVTVTVSLLLALIEDARELKAHENVLEVGDVPRPESDEVKLSLGGADASLFELDGSRLSFKPGKGDALGKWPDADDHGDADGDGVYELEVHQSLGLSRSAKYDLEVRVEEDAREDLGRRTHDLVRVEEGTTDTGVRLGKGRDGLNRKLSYSVRELEVDGTLFEVRNGGELHFREAPTFKDEGNDFFANIYSALIDVEDDDPGEVRNRGVDEMRRVQVVPRFSAESLSGTAEENDLSVYVGGFSGLSPYVTVTVGGGADAGQFEWSGGALRFKAGTGDALGKWPDADDAWDDDGDGKYTVEVVQRTKYVWSKSTVTVGVSADAREGLSFSSGTSVVTDSGVIDTGYRLQASSNLDRSVSYRIESGGSGGDFELVGVDGDELRFKSEPVYDGETLSNNVRTLTVTAIDDDPGAVKNEAAATLTVSLLLALIEDARELKAHENVLEVGDVPRPDNGGVKLSLGGADASLFELDGSRLSFKPGKGDALGKWPDADDHGDADGDGVYELEVHQSLGLSRSAKYDLEVTVAEDARENLVRMKPTGSVEEGMTDTGVRLNAVRGELKREVSYRPRTEDHGALFEVRNGVELHFREAPAFKSEERGYFSNSYFVSFDVEDDDPGLVKNRVVDLARVVVVPRLAAESLSGTAVENELSVDVGGFSGLSPHVTLSLAGGEDSALFELSGGALRFKAGEGESLGKWPDADEARDADGDGKYTVEVAQRTEYASTPTSTVTVDVSADAREELSFSSGTSVVTEGGVDTGYRAEAASELGDRKMFYEVISGGDGELFNVAGDELKFRAPQYWVPDGSNRYTVTLKATDDDPGAVNNEAYVTVTVSLLLALIEDARELKAHENVLEVGDVPRPESDEVKLSLGGADASLFELDGSRLSFKPGKGDALGKWPDADDHGDADGDGVYELEVHQSLGLSRSAKYDLEVTVEEDAREDLGAIRRYYYGNSIEGSTYTGVRMGGRAFLNRDLSYRVRDMDDGAFFELRNGGELHFKEAAKFRLESGASNNYSVLIDVEDDDPGVVKNEATWTVSVWVGPSMAAWDMWGTAEENELAVNVEGFSVLNPHVKLLLRGADAQFFVVDGQRLSFKPGEGDALGKWPDADEAGDADGDGKYTVGVIQNLNYHDSNKLWTQRSTLTVEVSADAREGLSFSSGTSVVTEGGVDTGYRAAAVSELGDRKMVYEVISGGDGALFNVAVDELKFRAPQYWVPDGSNRYTVTLKAEDDDPGGVKNEAYVTVTVTVEPAPLVSGPVAGVAEENDLAVDVESFSGLGSYVTLSLAGGEDSALFELSGGALRFKAGEGESLGKWPDADDAGDIDGDGKYTVEIEQADGVREATATVIVSVKPDTREGLSFSSGTSVVTEGGVDTGYRAAAVSELGDRKMVYEVISGGDGALFNVAVDELKFRAPQYWVPDGSNRYTVTLKAEDDDPGGVKNEAYVTVTVTVNLKDELGLTAGALAPGDELRRNESDSVSEILLPAGVGGLGELTYVLGTTSPDDGRFKLSGWDDHKVTVVASSLDYESVSRYTLTLTVTDGRDKEGVGEYVLNVDNVRERASVTLSVAEILEIDEGETAYVMLTSQASGGVGGGAHRYGISWDTPLNDNELFALSMVVGTDRNYMKLTFGGKLDFENPVGVQRNSSDLSRRNDYLVDVYAVDDDRNRGVARVTVRVRDVKELGFEGGATVTVGYQDGSGWPKVHRLQVTNAPVGEYVTYQISSSDRSGLFKVNRNTGAVRFARAAPRYAADGNNEYRTTVQARVAGTTVSASQVLVVKVLNLGFEAGASVTVTYQDGAKSPRVHRSQLTNAPAGEDVTYRISSSDTSGLFKVSRHLGAVKFAGTPPRYAADGNNEYRTTVDASVFGATASQVLVVTVSPSLEFEGGDLIKMEYQDNVWPQVLHQASVTNAPDGEEMTYRISSSDTSGLFKVNMTSGNVKLADKAPEYDSEGSNVYRTTVVASTDGGMTGLQVLELTVLESSPDGSSDLVFEGGATATVEVSVSATGAAPTDRLHRARVWGVDHVSYRLLDGGDVFKVNSISGNIKFKNGVMLKAAPGIIETRYTVVVEAKVDDTTIIHQTVAILIKGGMVW